MIIEGFDYMKMRNTIEGLSVDELLELLESGVSNNYNLRTVLYKINETNKNGIIIYDINTGQRKLLHCIKDYYNIGNEATECRYIQNKLSEDNEYIENCIDCHKLALLAYKNKKLNKKNL